MLRSIRTPRIFHIFAKAQIGNHPVYGPHFSILDHLSDPDTQGKEPRPHCFHQEQVLLFGRLNKLPRLRRVDCEGLFTKNMLVGKQAKHGILIVMGVRRSDVDDVDIWVFRELLIGAIGQSRRWTLACFEELFSSRAAARRCCGCNCVFDIGYLTGGGIQHQILGELYSSRCYSGNVGSDL